MTTVKVFRRDPVWEQYEESWMVPLADKLRLLIAGYTIDDDDDLIMYEVLKEVRARHPDDVIIFW